MAVTVTLTVTTCVITFADGTTHNINLNQCNDVTMAPPRQVFTVDTNKSFDFPPGLGPVVDYLPEIQNWAVEIHFNDGRVVAIPMGDVTGRPTWTNDQAGAVIAAAELDNYFFTVA